MEILADARMRNLQSNGKIQEMRECMDKFIIINLNKSIIKMNWIKST